MIGKSEWFSRRKYSGWGLTPITWQGYLYVGILVLCGITLSVLPITPSLKTLCFFVLIGVVVIDVLHIMASMTLDERETKIEAISERNASWAMVASLALIIFYISSAGLALTGKEIIPFLMVPLFSGVIAKAISNYVLQKSDL